MEPPKAAPLQIPHEEDDVPLFDPSGLSASLSADDWHSSFDLNSPAAARLGIGSPSSLNGSGFLSTAASVGNLTRSDSRNEAATEANGSFQPPNSLAHARSSSNDADLQADGAQSVLETDATKRGRRRRSSAQHDAQQASPSLLPATLPQKDTSVGSKVRMWWERSAAPEVDATDSSVVERDSRSSAAPPPLRTDQKTLASSSAAPDTTVASPSSMTQDTASFSSPTVRSPAADFLNAFSSLNSVIQPSTSYDSRSLSYSPPRSGHRSLSASLMRDETRNGSAAAPGLASWRGLGSVAAQLYDSTTAPNPPPRNDDEGARVGPSGRYLLGKTIGVGGFSTVREGWDLEAQGPADPTAPMVEGQRRGRRVAVKIVYHDQQHLRQDRDAHEKQRPHQKHSQELRIWKSLPLHPHLLPLLHHESVSLDSAHADTSRPSEATAELLIMPYCDQGNLLDFVRAEGGAKDTILIPTGNMLFAAADDSRRASGSWTAPGSATSSTQISRTSSLRTSKNDPSWRHPGSRTGSGFVLARNAGTQALGRVASVSAASQLRTIPAGQEVASNGSSPVSAAGSVSSGSRLLRRTDSRIARSQGIPLDAAREIMRQLSSAIKTLHNRCHVLHGDLKLENVLGQDQTSWKKRQRVPTTSSEDEIRSRQNSGALTDSTDSLASVSVSSRQTFDVREAVMPCWRIADFGLAQDLNPAHPEGGMPSAPALIRALKEEASAIGTPEHTAGQKKSRKSSRGGSLAYTAPEFLQARGTPGWSSPAAAESAAEKVDLPPESPFAADMWSLGCILYALLSGKLPFTDNFEPRLQMKIAKAQWELPPRLRRRAERLTNLSTSTLTSQASQAHRNSSTDRAGSVGPADAADRFAFSQRRPVSGLPHSSSSFGVMDMSSSLPALAPRERQLTEPPSAATSESTFAVHSDFVVGSAPGRADHLESFEINQAAKARADVEEDPESDDDLDVDPAWDGLSWDRAAARQVLRGLLEPDPRQRWTIDKLCSSAWIRQDGAEASPLPTTSLLGDPQGARAVSSPAAASVPCTKGFSPQFVSTPSALAAPAPSTSASESSRTPVPDSANLRESHYQPSGSERRSSSLARTRPAHLALDSPASPSSSTQSPSISIDEDDSSKRRSRSTSRISLRYRDSSRNRSTDVSGSSTPNRERDLAWASHHLASSHGAQMLPWIHSAAKERSDSPADSERRGRMPRSRMADLDENTTWNGDEATSSGSRTGLLASDSSHRAGPIAIRDRSQSRSRSRQSGDSSSPERIRQRSVSRSRSTHSLSHETAAGAGILYGRSMEPQPYVAPIMADHTQAQRSATARSRSRAPDALAQILGRDRSRSRSRAQSSMEASASRSTPSLLGVRGTGRASATEEDDKVPTDERDHVARGRSRDRR